MVQTQGTLSTQIETKSYLFKVTPKPGLSCANSIKPSFGSGSSVNKLPKKETGDKREPTRNEANAAGKDVLKDAFSPHRWNQPWGSL